jgi:hypothetical protein
MRLAAPLSTTVKSRDESNAIIMPDGLQHPKFRLRRSGAGFYVLCKRSAIHELIVRGKHRRFGRMHPAIDQQIGHQLRLRILQELSLLADRLSPRKRTPRSPIVRRLTRDEFAQVREEGLIKFPAAIALLVVPPVNRDTSTRLPIKPTDSFDEGPLPAETVAPKRPKLPLSVLHHTAPTPDDYNGEVLPLPEARVPLYNGSTLFPHRAQRAALHKALCAVLAAERRTSDKSKEDSRNSQTAKASHAFLLCSDAETVTCVDAVPLAIALWRLRMWEQGCS